MNRFQFKNIIFTLVLSCMFSTFLKAQTGQATINQDARITQLVDLHSKMILADKLSDRYKIQLFSGDATTASSTLKKYRNRVGTWSSSIKHETPNYKVWVGNFRNKLEAERALIDIRKTFPIAFIFKPAR
ncbi:SPOR domain-containing protein [Dokdonia sp. Hel_I_53]|uniref:SPOR domain-containing protein n=1 Tax=Dokdonia sp. Hel_I_53 TaxID=1566287 RepID=UPI001198E3CB|nr:SPOR domain-containing protein [Dokdonia sp. Hel_I_53]TVZ52253.1 hypothetical protein OD90_1423 [Dokdonia sp. Hel_I_53]